MKGDGSEENTPDALTYENIEIEWVRGKAAVLHIYNHDDEELEQIALHELKTIEEMNEMMIKKGFSKIPEDNEDEEDTDYFFEEGEDEDDDEDDDDDDDDDEDDDDDDDDDDEEGDEL